MFNFRVIETTSYNGKMFVIETAKNKDDFTGIFIAKSDRKAGDYLKTSVVMIANSQEGDICLHSTKSTKNIIECVASDLQQMGINVGVCHATN